MKLAKSLLLGSAAGLVAVAGAQAADLPVRAAAPVDYVRVCPAQGTGFFFIPGTETCLRVGGYVRVEARFDERRASTVVPVRAQDDFTFFARGQVFFDARTATEFGTLRSFVRLNADRPAGTTVLDQGFIQFAGLTAGRITSFFDFWGGNLMRGGLQTDETTELFAYTATFGGGFSATVSVENPRRSTPVGLYGGRNLPDLVANLNVAQAWGSAQIMGALHQVRVSPLVNAAGIGDKTGWAVGAGVTVNLPMLAPGSAIWLQGVYADGALGYTYVGGARDFRRVTIPAFSDAYVVGGTLRTTKSWLLSAAIRHFWTPAIWSDLQGSWGQIDVPTGVAAGVARDTTLWQIGKRLNWRPVAGLTFSGEVTYTEGRRSRLVTDPVDFRRNDNRWGATIRVQRDF
ncbi:porin [Salinarimonas sp.]|uniref:porin n=1 Tax=Salinarimonas sp. TaxID=2766526 RepID=UPI00391BE50D